MTPQAAATSSIDVCGEARARRTPRPRPAGSTRGAPRAGAAAACDGRRVDRYTAECIPLRQHRSRGQSTEAADGHRAGRVHRGGAAGRRSRRRAADRRRACAATAGSTRTARYVSPRTKHRVPAIEAWQATHTSSCSAPTSSTSRSRRGRRTSRTSTQARFLIRSGVPEPLIATLTRIGTVEGFGANIRLLQPSGPADAASSRTSPAPPSTTSAAACSRPTAATRPAGRRRPATRTCGSPPATSPSRAASADIDVEAMLARMGFGQPGARRLDGRARPARRHRPRARAHGRR